MLRATVFNTLSLRLHVLWKILLGAFGSLWTLANYSCTVSALIFSGHSALLHSSRFIVMSTLHMLWMCGYYYTPQSIAWFLTYGMSYWLHLIEFTEWHFNLHKRHIKFQKWNSWFQSLLSIHLNNMPLGSSDIQQPWDFRKVPSQKKYWDVIYLKIWIWGSFILVNNILSSNQFDFPYWEYKLEHLLHWFKL